MAASRLTLQDLQSDLWNCAQILRGSAIDRTDWKGWILPLLFFKRISDVEKLSGVPLGNREVASDVLGDAYEYLIGRFADVTRRKKAGEFYTPRSVVRMMVELLDPRAGESIYDPACGTGGMLLGAIEHAARAGGDPRTFFGRIFGEEKNLTTSSIARMNLVLHGVEDFRIEQNDTLRRPAFTDPSGALAAFDCVIANPPFSLKEWGREVWEADPWGRAAFGLPPPGYGDYAWVQQMVASMAAGSGRMAVVLPQGALFRKGAEGRIRRALSVRRLRWRARIAFCFSQREDRRKHRCQDEEPHYRPRGERNALEQRHEQGRTLEQGCEQRAGGQHQEPAPLAGQAAALDGRGDRARHSGDGAAYRHHRHRGAGGEPSNPGPNSVKRAHTRVPRIAILPMPP